MAKIDPKDIRPFLPFAALPTRAFGQAIPTIETPEVTSPWLPKPVAAIEEAPRPIGPTADEIAQIIDDARAQGQAEGLAETAALRAQLAKLTEAFRQATAQIVAPTADTIADVALCAIEAWFGHAERGAQLGPVIRAWLSHSAPDPDDPDAPPPPAATVRVHPKDVEAIRTTITEALAEADSAAKLDVVGDARLSPGAIAIASPGLELSHSWQARLPELRAAIVAALVGTDDATDDADA